MGIDAGALISLGNRSEEGFQLAPGADSLGLLGEALVVQHGLVVHQIAVGNIVAQNGHAVDSAAEGVGAQIVAQKLLGFRSIVGQQVGDVHGHLVVVHGTNAVADAEAHQVDALAAGDGGLDSGDPVADHEVVQIHMDALGLRDGIHHVSQAFLMVLAVGVVHIDDVEDNIHDLFRVNRLVHGSGGLVGLGRLFRLGRFVCLGRCGVGLSGCCIGIGGDLCLCAGRKQAEGEGKHKNQRKGKFHLFHKWILLLFHRMDIFPQNPQIST